ncbi:uncharacterized protein LOC117316428 [Pecten maximus]|uniref:uncharacterized protein LOC117316428 n=1 Tax=Pecten maximus TaxID=6579 RepID=UPI001457FF5D|nr:uncharacterized protein LOC117316428 [Pecten maximus]
MDHKSLEAPPRESLIAPISHRNNDVEQECIFNDHRETINEFNKRQLGRLIIKHCGNEGSEDNEEKGSMRRLLQEAIDYLPKERELIWKNAKVTIYDIKGNSLEITSGSGMNEFFIHHNIKGETTIVKKENKGFCVIS